jgi:aminoglycoside phosphotransferase (APT) family kinase protein
MDREVNMSWSTSPTEIVTCRLDDDRDLRVLCKYNAPNRPDSRGHRGGLMYEARVYRDLVARLPLPAPKFYGTWTDPASGTSCLVLEYLDDGIRLHKVEEPGRMQAAARWLGAFHAFYADARPTKATGFLTHYDRDYYTGWVGQTADQIGVLRSHAPWLSELCSTAAEWIDRLLAAPVTVVHGEYYPDNIIVRQHEPHPIDWESAAVAPGEVDLAALTGGEWPEGLVRECEQEYSAARWAGVVMPEHFPATLAAARMYLHFRWLGDQAAQEVTPPVRSRLAQLDRDARTFRETI